MTTEFKDKSTKLRAWNVCREFLDGPWKNISLDELRIFELRGGLSNSIYRCALPENAVVRRGIPKEVLYRVYGPLQDDPNVVVSEAVTFMLLSERELGPKLYGLFPKGRLEEFIPSHSLSSDELRLYSQLIAREMAKIHALDVPLKKVPDIFTVAPYEWLDEIEEILLNDKENSFMSYNEFKKELEWVSKEAEKTKEPIVFCHNDLQGGNVLFREDSTQNSKPCLMLIDFEFGSYNYRSFDFGNHFIEWCFDYDTDEYPHFQMDMNKFPTTQEQREYLNAYFDQLSNEDSRLKISEDEVSKILREMPLFVCAACLIWSIWSIKMLLSSTAGFSFKIYLRNSNEETRNNKNGTTSNNYRETIEAIEIGIVAAIQEFCKIRRKLYYKFKEQYLTSISNSANDLC